MRKNFALHPCSPKSLLFCSIICIVRYSMVLLAFAKDPEVNVVDQHVHGFYPWPSGQDRVSKGSKYKEVGEQTRDLQTCVG